MADVADYTQAVNVTGGSVAITGTATVSISGTPTVSISGTPNVNISNTPAVTISSGSVTATISGTPNINIQSQAVTVNVNQPPTKLTDLTFSAGTNTQTTGSVPAGTHALMLGLKSGNMGSATFQVKGHTTGNQYAPPPGASPIPVLSQGAVWVVPVDSAQDLTYDITINTLAGGTMAVSAILDTEAVWAMNSSMLPLYTFPAVAGLQVELNSQPVVPAFWSGTVTSAPAQGSQASATLAGVSSRFWTASMIAGGFTQNAAIAFSMNLQVLDGASVVFNHIIGAASGPGNTPNASVSGMAIKTAASGSSMTFRLNASNGNLSEVVSGGAYQG